MLVWLSSGPAASIPWFAKATSALASGASSGGSIASRNSARMEPPEGSIARSCSCVGGWQRRRVGRGKGVSGRGGRRREGACVARVMPCCRWHVPATHSPPMAALTSHKRYAPATHQTVIWCRGDRHARGGHGPCARRAVLREGGVSGVRGESVWVVSAAFTCLRRLSRPCAS